MNTSGQTSHKLLLAGLATAGLVYLLGNNNIPLWDRDEPRFAQASREMLEGRNFIVPHFNGEYRFDKPVLIYWLMTVSYRVLGAGDLGARFVSSVCGVTACWVMYLVGSRLFNRRVGLWATAILASCPLFLVESKLATADALLMVFMVAGMGLWLALQSAARRWYHALLLGLALGLATLTKGPVVWLFLWAGSMATVSLRIRRNNVWPVGVALASLVLLVGMYLFWGLPKALESTGQVVVLLAWLGAGLMILALPVAGAISGQQETRQIGWKFIESYGLVLLGMGIAMLIFLPWGLAAVAKTGGAYWTEGVGRHVVQRSASSLEGHWGPPGYYLASWLVCAFPWSVLGPVAVWQGWRLSRRDWRISGLLGWVLGPWLVLEAVQTKLVHYVLGCYPAMALLIAVLLYRWRGKLNRKLLNSRPGRMGLSAMWIVGVVVGVAIFTAVGMLCVGPLAELSGTGRPQYELLLPAGLAGLVVLATGLLVKNSLTKGSSGGAVAWGFAGVMVWGVIAGGWLAPAVGKQGISPKAAAVAGKLSPPGTQFVLFGYDEPSIIWYLGQGNKKVLIARTAEEFASIFAGPEKACGIVSQEKMEDLLAKGLKPGVVCRTVTGLYLNEWRSAGLWVGLNKAGEEK